MKNYKFLDEHGSFEIKEAENDLGFYFPLASETGLKCAITPNLAGDIKTDQNHFLLEPVSIENLHNNKSSRNFWVKVSKKGAEPVFWSATGASAAQEMQRYCGNQDESKIQAGYMWHKAIRKSATCDLRSEVTSFAIPTKNIEVMHVLIANEGNENLIITPTAAIPVYGRSADNLRDHRHVTALLHRGKLCDYGLEVTPTLSFDERGHQVNDTKYFVLGMEGMGIKPVGFFPEVAKFLGKGGSFMWPEAVVTDRVFPVVSKATIDGQELVGAIRFEHKELAPGESAEYTLFLGICGKDEDATSLVAPFMTHVSPLELLEETRAYWTKKCNIAIHTGNEEFDQFMAWVEFQPELRRLFGCSFLPHHDYGKGGRGWRDLWQDCLALLLMNPDGVRSMLVGNFAGVRMDGTNATIIGEKVGQFKADRNSITRVWMDHGVWPMVTTLFYLNQTGDYGLLDEEVNYFKDRQVMRGTAVDADCESSTWQQDRKGEVYKGTILEHLLLQNLTAFYEVGEHNNLRLRDADWNDAIDMASHRGESVAFTNAYAMNLNSLAEVLDVLKKNGRNAVTILEEMRPLFEEDCGLYDDVAAKQTLLLDYCKSCFHDISGRRVEVDIDKLSANLRRKADHLMEHIREQEWVRDEKGFGYFNSYYDDNARPLNGMMLTGQVFSVMAGTASPEQVAEIAKAADEYLYDESCGGYRLNVDFKEVKLDMGRMFGFAFGEKENGAVFSHMCVMYANALYKAGFAKEGYKALKALFAQSMNFEKSRIYPGIPEYFGKDGRGLYHYLTGAASWYLLTVVTEMFGVRGNGEGLVIEPKLLKEQFDKNNEAKISLVFRGINYDITISNPKGLEAGDYEVKKITCDGAEMTPKGLVELDSSSNHRVEVLLG